MKKAIVLINDTTYAYNLRSAILKELAQNGFTVVVVAEALKHVDRIEAIGCKFIPVDTGRHRMEPFSDYRLYRKYLRILKDERPDVVLTYNIKPNVYGGSACRRLGIPFIVNVTGLGKPLGKPGVFQNLVAMLYKHGIAGAACVFFQNESDSRFFCERNLMNKTQSVRLLPGSGVDLERYTFSEYPEAGPIRFLYAARIMREKGIEIFRKTADRFACDRIVFEVCGPCEDERYLNILKKDPSIQYHGEQDDLRSYYQRCSCFFFPSYYPEGLSNVLLEAAATGRPVITTKKPGCQEIVEDGVSGYLVSARDQEGFDGAVERFISLPMEQKRSMGLASRRIAETRFDRAQVVASYMEEMDRLLTR